MFGLASLNRLVLFLRDDAQGLIFTHLPAIEPEAEEKLFFSVAVELRGEVKGCGCI